MSDSATEATTEPTDDHDPLRATLAAILSDRHGHTPEFYFSSEGSNTALAREINRETDSETALLAEGDDVPDDLDEDEIHWVDDDELDDLRAKMCTALAAVSGHRARFYYQSGSDNESIAEELRRFVGADSPSEDALLAAADEGTDLEAAKEGARVVALIAAGDDPTPGSQKTERAALADPEEQAANERAESALLATDVASATTSDISLAEYVREIYGIEPREYDEPELRKEVYSREDDPSVRANRHDLKKKEAEAEMARSRESVQAELAGEPDPNEDDVDSEDMVEAALGIDETVAFDQSDYESYAKFAQAELGIDPTEFDSEYELRQAINSEDNGDVDDE